MKHQDLLNSVLDQVIEAIGFDDEDKSTVKKMLFDQVRRTWDHQVDQSISKGFTKQQIADIARQVLSGMN